MDFEPKKVTIEDIPVVDLEKFLGAED